MDVGLLHQMQWNIELIQLLWVAVSPWTKNLYKYSLWVLIVILHSALAAPYSLVFDAHFAVTYCADAWLDKERKRLYCSVSIRQACVRAWGFTTSYSHIPTLHTWLKVIPPGLRWAQISVCHKCNWRNLKIHPSWWGQIASPCPAMWGPLTERMNTIEGLFLPEQAKGTLDDKRPLDSKDSGGSRKDSRRRQNRWSSVWNTDFKHNGYFHFPLEMLKIIE